LLLVAVVVDFMEVVEVLVDFFGMDHQHQQRLQMDQQLHIVIAQHIR
jgi:Tfp pilus assembly pilus retraction ATPase PilT